MMAFRRFAYLAAPFLFTAPPCLGANEEKHVSVHSRDFLIDREMPHMRGPSDEIKFQLAPKTAKKKLFWITEAEVTRFDRKETQPDEYMCHAWVHQLNIPKGYPTELTYSTFKQTASTRGRLFTLSVNAPKVRLPKGFGLPIESSGELSYYFMVASSFKPKSPFKRTLRGHVSYLPDGPDTRHFKALFRRSLFSAVPIDQDACHWSKHATFDPEKKWECVKGKTLPFMHLKDKFGKTFSAHWWADPGKTTNVTLVTEMLRIPFDTTIHMIGIHIHPGVKKVILRDLTAGKDIFVSEVEKPAPNAAAHSGHAHKHKGHHMHVAQPTKEYSSTTGIPVFQSHEYALISEVQNDLSEPVDIMTTLHVYLHDRGFRRIAPAKD